MNASSKIKEFSLNEILIISWEICKKYFRDIFPIAFIVYLPMNIFLALLPIENIINILPALLPIGNIDDFKSYSYLSWFEIFGKMNISIYLSFLGNILLSLLIKDRLANNKTNFKQIIKHFTNLTNKDLIINFTMIFVVFVCFNLWMYLSILYPTVFFVLLIPLIFYLINWCFTIYIFAYKEINLYEAMKYSYSMVYYRWGKVFLKVLLLILFSQVTTSLAGLPYSYLHNTFFIKIFYTNIVSVLTSYFVVAFIIFYINFDDTKR